MGTRHWQDYEKFSYDEIPVLLHSYEPQNLYKVSAIRSLWVTWCKFFNEHEDDDPQMDVWIDDWLVHLIENFREQFYRRVSEAPAMIQWQQIAQERRTAFREEGTQERIPEKEFLLVHSQKIKTNAEFLPTQGELSQDDLTAQLITKWVGNAFLLKLIDHDALHGNKPKFKLQHGVWTEVLQELNPLFEDPPSSTWRVDLPRSVANPI